MGTPTAPTSRASLLRHAVPLLAVLLLGLAVQRLAVSRGRVLWTSDTAVVGLMARDILRGETPVFYYGSDYPGSLEAYWVALVFAALGPSVSAYFVALHVLLALLIVLVYAIGVTCGGRGVGLAAAAYLAVAPPYFFSRGLTSDGGYTSVAVLSAAILLAALRLEDALRRGRRPWPSAAGLGLAAGLGWWVNPLTLAALVPALGWLLLTAARRLARPAVPAVLVATFVLGSLPWWVSNLRDPWHCLRSSALSRVGLDALIPLAVQFWTLGTPVLFGSRAPTVSTATFPGEAVLTGLFFLAPLVAAVVCCWRHPDALAEADPDEDDLLARRLVLLLGAAAAVPLLALTSSRTWFAEPRFCFALFAVFPVLFALALRQMARGPVAAKGLAALLVAAAAFFAAHGLTYGGGQYFGPGLDLPADRPAFANTLAPLADALRRAGVRSAYANYWDAYRLTFESGEEVVASPFSRRGLVRIDAHRRRVDADPAPAVVFSGPTADAFRRHLDGNGLPYQLIQAQGYSAFHGLAPEFLAGLRAEYNAPEPRR